LAVGGGRKGDGREVAQTMYILVSKCENDKRKKKARCCDVVRLPLNFCPGLHSPPYLAVWW
jgi:hypothetical protein